MLIDDINNFYHLKFSSFIKSFATCSSDSANHTNLVSDTRNCFSFDDIKDSFFLTKIRSADSLYNSKKVNKMFFIEFKNTEFDQEVQDNVKEKAGDSLFVNKAVLDTNVENYNAIDLSFVLVISSSKNPANSILSAILAVSEFNSVNINSYLGFDFASIIDSYISRNYPHMSERYKDISVVFSDEFTSFIDTIY